MKKTYIKPDCKTTLADITTSILAGTTWIYDGHGGKSKVKEGNDDESEDEEWVGAKGNNFLWDDED